MAAPRRTKSPPYETMVEVRNDLYLMLVSTLRYSMGRQTYMVAETCRLVQKYWKFMDAGMREVLIRDLAQELERVEQRGNFLGSDFDHNDWATLLINLRQRQEEGLDDGEGS